MWSSVWETDIIVQYINAPRNLHVKYRLVNLESIRNVAALSVHSSSF